MIDSITIGEAFRTIAKRFRNLENSIDYEELAHTCNNCKFCHRMEGIEQEWYTRYCVHSWCDKDEKLMDSWERNEIDHYVTPCDYFEEGKGVSKLYEHI